jgi:hypothetical protein
VSAAVAQKCRVTSRLLDGGASLSEIDALLGHTQATTTARYAQVSKESQCATLARLPSPSKPVAMLEANYQPKSKTDLSAGPTIAVPLSFPASQQPRPPASYDEDQ